MSDAIGGYVLSASSQKTFMVGEPVVVVASLTNTTGDSLMIPQSPTEQIFDVTVTDPFGNKVPFTLHGQRLYNMMHGIFVYEGYVSKSALAAGQTKVFHLDVSRIYDLSETGDYVITLSRTVNTFGGSRFGILQSDPVRVSVVEADAAP